MVKRQADRAARKERWKAAIAKPEVLPKLSDFFRVCILSIHLSSKLCGASAGGIRVFTAHPGNVNKQTGTGGGKGGEGWFLRKCLKLLTFVLHW